MFLVISLKKIKKLVIFLAVAAIVAFGGYMAVKTLYPLKYINIIEKYSAQYKLDKALVCALIHAESHFDKDAVSNKDASGLMQLMRQTADWGAAEIGIINYSYDRILEPEINIQLGCWYLSRLITQYDGSTATALAAYNAGSGNVAKWLGNPEYSTDGESISNTPFPATNHYIDKIERNRKIYKYLLQIFGGTYE